MSLSRLDPLSHYSIQHLIITGVLKLINWHLVHHLLQGRDLRGVQWFLRDVSLVDNFAHEVDGVRLRIIYISLHLCGCMVNRQVLDSCKVRASGFRSGGLGLLLAGCERGLARTVSAIPRA